MPYIAEKKQILTKVIGVASKINDEDENKIRQVVLREIKEDPSKLLMVYLKQNEVYVHLKNDNHYHIGNLRDKYVEIIMKNVVRIKEYTITGGQPLIHKSVEILGNNTSVNANKRLSYVGMNLHIEIL